LHGDVLASMVLVDLVDRGNVGMMEAAGRLGLTSEACDLLVVAALEELERDPAPEDAVPRLPHLAHAAGAEPQRADELAEAGAGRRREHLVGDRRLGLGARVGVPPESD